MQTKPSSDEPAPTVYGYDGNGYSVGDRVELHPGCDLWMQGARYGEVVAFIGGKVRVKLDKPVRMRSVVSGSADTFKRIDSCECGCTRRWREPRATWTRKEGR